MSFLFVNFFNWKFKYFRVSIISQILPFTQIFNPRITHAEIRIINDVKTDRMCILCVINNLWLHIRIIKTHHQFFLSISLETKKWKMKISRKKIILSRCFTTDDLMILGLECFQSDLLIKDRKCWTVFSNIQLFIELITFLNWFYGYVWIRFKKSTKNYIDDSRKYVFFLINVLLFRSFLFEYLRMLLNHLFISASVSVRIAFSSCDHWVIYFSRLHH